MSLVNEMPPAQVTVRANTSGRWPVCGGCGRRLAHDKQWRCPYVACRQWLRSIDEIDADKAKELA